MTGVSVEVRGLKHKNVAAELLAKLLKDELKVRMKRNLVQSQLFSEKLKQTLNGYNNRAIATQEVIEELLKQTSVVMGLAQETLWSRLLLLAPQRSS